MKKPNPPADLWSRLDAIAGAPYKDDPGFTVTEFCERYNLTDRGGRWKIYELVRQGKLIEGFRKNAVNGRKTKVYRPA